MSANFQHSTVWFKDEKGTEGVYRYESEDWPSICDRAVKRLGLVADDDEPMRYARAKAKATKK